MLSHPVQLEKAELESAVAVNVTDVVDVYDDEHVEPQLMPCGELVIVPFPVLVTLRVYEDDVCPTRNPLPLLKTHISF